MALEARRRGTFYYYRATKVGGRVVKRYVGAGQFAVLARAIDEQRRAQARAETDERRTALAAFEAEEAPLAALFGRVERLAQGALLGAGYRRHDRGEWRRRRGGEPDHD